MEHDYCEHVKKCEQYQKYAHLELTPNQELNYVTSPSTFSISYVLSTLHLVRGTNSSWLLLNTITNGLKQFL